MLASSGPLCDHYDLAMLDLDGVVYIGGDAVPGAAEHLARVRDTGMRCAFITNNASRPPARVAEHLSELGVPATTEDVVTSAQAAARVLRDRLGDGAPVAMLGGAGLEAALTEAGLRPVPVDAEEARAVVSGYGPEVLWRDVMRAAVRIRDGLWWVASNTDRTIPTPFGVAPGHGVLVETLARFAEVEPEVAGKPARPLLDETVRRMAADRPLMVGDRLDTDIEGAQRAGVDSLLVLTGVTGLAELVAARPKERPTYLAPDLGGLSTAQPEVREDDGRWQVGGWSAEVVTGVLEMSGGGEQADWWRAVAACAWASLDATGSVVDTGDLAAPVPGDQGSGG